MIVRIRLQHGEPHQNRRIALGLAALLNPLALMACALALWRVGADLGWTGEFAITEGLLSHWQVWFAAAAAIELAAIALNRYGKADASIPNSEEKPANTLLNSGF
jgi:hypothetical protein